VITGEMIPVVEDNEGASLTALIRQTTL